MKVLFQLPFVLVAAKKQSINKVYDRYKPDNISNHSRVFKYLLFSNGEIVGKSISGLLRNCARVAMRSDFVVEFAES